MKKIFRNILMIATVALAAASCGDVAEDERFNQVERGESRRVVLIEDFTGQKCVNCPEAHKVIDNLFSVVGHEAIVAVAIHGGSQAYSAEKYPFGLGTSDGEEYVKANKVEAFPAGLINRTGGLLSHSEWSGAVYEQFKKEPEVDVEIKSATLADGKLSIETVLKPDTDIKGKLQLWLIEDGIVAMQYSNSGLDANYVHNHVLRCAINGTWGEDVTLTKGIHNTTTHEFDNLNEGWKPENLSVVAFVYNDTKGVLQAAQLHVSSPTEE